jgi:hypothetical protein
MENSLTFLSRYMEAWSIRNRRQHSSFKWQLARYFRAQMQAVERWEEAPQAEPPVLAALDEELFRRFGITSQALRYYAELQRMNPWSRADACFVIEALGRVQLDALNGS